MEEITVGEKLAKFAEGCDGMVYYRPSYKYIAAQD